MNWMSAAAATALALAASEAAAQPRLVVRGAAAHIAIIPEDRADIDARVTPAPGSRAPVPDVRRDGEALVIDGRLENRIRSCNTDGRGRSSIVVTGLGRLDGAMLPVITVRAPRALAATIANAAETKVGALDSGDLTFTGCGDADMGPVAHDLRVSLDGSGDVNFGAVGGALSARLAGSGDLHGGTVTGAADLRLDGSGDVGVAAVGAGLSAALDGSGDIQTDRIVGAARLEVDGSGDVKLGPVSGGLTVSLDGSGDVVVASVNGITRLDLGGSGDIAVNGGAAPSLIVEADGSGDLAFAGVAGDVDARAGGGGDVRIARATGQVRADDDGSGAIHVGR